MHEFVTGEEREREGGGEVTEKEGEKGTSVRFPFSAERINSI